jgi:hypothetical protein
MPPATRQRILPIDQLNSEWRTLGRSEGAVRSLHLLAERDPVISLLVHGTGSAAIRGARCRHRARPPTT